MTFFQSIKQKLIEKKEELNEKRRFNELIEEKAKPIRRAAYMKQMLKESIKEGIEKAKIDAALRLPKPKPTAQEFGINSFGLEDPYKFINKKEVKNGDIQKEENSNKSNSTRRRRKS